MYVTIKDHENAMLKVGDQLKITLEAKRNINSENIRKAIGLIKLAGDEFRVDRYHWEYPFLDIYGTVVKNPIPVAVLVYALVGLAIMGMLNLTLYRIQKLLFPEQIGGIPILPVIGAVIFFLVFNRKGKTKKPG